MFCRTCSVLCCPAANVQLTALSEIPIESVASLFSALRFRLSLRGHAHNSEIVR
jgi:hypothetical protein